MTKEKVVVKGTTAAKGPGGYWVGEDAFSSTTVLHAPQPSLCDIEKVTGSQYGGFVEEVESTVLRGQ